MVSGDKRYFEKFQHTAARRRLARCPVLAPSPMRCFNTQPPEGGWGVAAIGAIRAYCFNTQPPEGGWCFDARLFTRFEVSTHSRPKAAGIQIVKIS